MQTDKQHKHAVSTINRVPLLKTPKYRYRLYCVYTIVTDAYPLQEKPWHGKAGSVRCKPKTLAHQHKQLHVLKTTTLQSLTAVYILVHVHILQEKKKHIVYTDIKWCVMKVTFSLLGLLL